MIKISKNDFMILNKIGVVDILVINDKKIVKDLITKVYWYSSEGLKWVKRVKVIECTNNYASSTIPKYLNLRLEEQL